MATAAQMIAWAKSQIGYHEGVNNDNKYAAIAGVANHQSWCATFLMAGAKTVGVTLPGGGDPYTPTFAQEFQRAGQWHSTPQPGDLGFVYYNDEGRIGHVFLVIAVSGGNVVTVEGNTNNTGAAQGDGVYSHTRPASRIGNHDGVVGYGRPAYASTDTPWWPALAGYSRHRTGKPAPFDQVYVSNDSPSVTIDKALPASVAGTSRVWDGHEWVLVTKNPKADLPPALAGYSRVFNGKVWTYRPNS